MEVKIKLKEGAILPTKGSENAMCWDCYAADITPPNLVNAEDRRPDTLLPISSNFLLPVSADLDIFSSSDFN